LFEKSNLNLKITRFCYASWCKIVDSFKPNFFKYATPITELAVEEAMLPIFTYLDQNFSRLNESLDRAMLNNFLRDRYPHLVKKSTKIQNPNTASDKSDGDELLKKKTLKRKDTLAHRSDMEQDAPSLICLVFWNELVTRMRNHLNTFGGRNDSSSKKIRGDSTLGRRALSDDEKRQVEVLDIVLEYLKAFFYCDIDGRNCGFSVDDLEDKTYCEVKEILSKLLPKQEK
jgi:hypothetical protein